LSLLKSRQFEWRNDTAHRPHSTTLHLTLDTMHCTLSGCRSHFTLTTTGPIHFSSPTAYITTEIQEHYLTWLLASITAQTILGDSGQHSSRFRSNTSRGPHPLAHVLLGLWITSGTKCTPLAHRLRWLVTIVT
jgi:hypothetical protein